MRARRFALAPLFAALAAAAGCDRPRSIAPPSAAPPAVAPVDATQPTTPPPAEGSTLGVGRAGLLPFARIRAIALAAAPGEIVEVELEGVDHDHGAEHGADQGTDRHDARDVDERPVYEIKVLAPSGRVVELEIDARDGAIVSLEAE